MKVHFLILLIFSTIVVFPQNNKDTSQIVAIVGNHNTTFKDYLDRYEDYLIATGIKDNMQARFAILNNMINEVLLRNYDNNSEIYKNPEYIKEMGWIKKETILAYLKDQEVYAKITASEDELKQAYIRSKTDLSVRHLYASTEKEADNLYNLVKIGVSFEELAKQCFTDTTLKNNGGYLGFIKWGETDPDFENAAYSLRIGEISKPVKTAQGYSIIKVEDKIHDPFVTENGFVNMKHKLERAVKISKKIPAEAAYLKKVFDNSQLKFNDKALDAVLNDLKKTDYANFKDLEFNSTGKIFKDCVRYKDKIYSQKEIEKKLLEVPKYNRDLLTDVTKLKDAVSGLIMQDVLMGIAHESGYDTISYVSETENKLYDNIFLNYKKNEIYDLVPVSDSEIVKYYNDNIDFYKSEREMNVQEIVVNNDSLSMVLKSKIERGEDFGQLAEKYSLRKWSAAKKGVMGFSPVSFFGDMKDTLWDSPIGNVFGPIKFDNYFGLFRVLDKKEGVPVDIGLVKKQITSNIQNIKGFPYMIKRLETLTKKTSVWFNTDLIKNYNFNLAE
ncbi:MAG: peptidylprolyl isomerase [Ignavibacteriaceae bacterium]|nr:peptidylprolyl isomerase [Ignavibacteriaceae bacterium]